MSISNWEIEKLFALSKMRVEARRMGEVREKLSLIWEMIEQIGKVDCSDVPPLVVVSQQNDALGDDRVVKLNDRRDLFANLPEVERDAAAVSGYYRVPRVLEE